MPSKKLAVSGHLAVSEIRPEILKVIDEADFSDWDRETFISAGEEASKVKYYSQWILGKLAHHYCKKWGDLPDYARSIHQEPDSVRVYRWVYRRITEAKPDYVPDGFLTWGALQIIARYDKPIELIEELSKKGKVTMGEVTRHIKDKERKKKGKKPYPSKPKVKITFNEELELFELEIKEKDWPMFNWRGKFGKSFYKYLRKVWRK